MLAVTRYRVPTEEVAGFRLEAGPAVEALAARPGCLWVRFGNAVDEPGLWVLASAWEHVGAYRRALSAPEVKITAVRLMYRCIDEPTAFEDLITWLPGEGVREHDSEVADRG